MEEITAFTKAIPSAAASPLALVAYLATLGAWTLITWRVRRFRELLQKIELLPEPDRIKALQMELGYVPVLKGLTAEQYLRSRIHTLLVRRILGAVPDGHRGRGNGLLQDLTAVRLTEGTISA
jgi:hypothetical protein